MTFPSGVSVARITGPMMMAGPPTGLYEIYGIRASGDPKYLILELIPYSPQVADTAMDAFKDRQRKMNSRMDGMLKEMPKETASFMREFVGTFSEMPPHPYMPSTSQGPPIQIPIEKSEFLGKQLEIGSKVTNAFNVWEEEKPKEEKRPDSHQPVSS